jgi:hypothetical protein
VTTYWINTVSRDHVRVGVAGGFTQANHGRPTTLRQLARGDLVVFYSPCVSYPSGQPLQRFTALGRVSDDTPYQAEVTPTFHPWQRGMRFLACEEMPIQPLLDELTFVTDKQRWGYAFRRGLFQIGAEDFERIARAMKVDLGNSDVSRALEPT